MFGKKRNTIFARTVGTVKAHCDFYRPNHDSKLQYNRQTKEWFLLIPTPTTPPTIPTDRHDMVSIDPGEKIFLTLYSPDKGGHVMKICEDNRSGPLFYKLKRLDELISKRARVSKKKGRGLTRAIHRIQKKIRNMKNDLHHKTSLFLCKNYNHILLPEYKSQPMLQTLTSSVCRSMSTLSFYQFRQKLSYKSLLYGSKLYTVTEEYTSSTCGGCGTYNKPQDRAYNCSKCNLSIHRDYNGARNILLKNLKPL
jgi:putative transposase